VLQEILSAQRFAPPRSRPAGSRSLRRRLPRRPSGRSSDTDRARDLLCGGENISARDAVHAAVMLNHGLTEIATLDDGFDRIEAARRVRL
jgi:predicted nucleic acid-binding protein